MRGGSPGRTLNREAKVRDQISSPSFTPLTTISTILLCSDTPTTRSQSIPENPCLPSTPIPDRQVYQLLALIAYLSIHHRQWPPRKFDQCHSQLRQGQHLVLWEIFQPQSPALHSPTRSFSPSHKLENSHTGFMSRLPPPAPIP